MQPSQVSSTMTNAIIAQHVSLRGTATQTRCA